VNYQNRILLIVLLLICTASAAEDTLVTTLTPPQTEQAVAPKSKIADGEVITFSREEIEASNAKTIGDLLVAQGFKDESKYLCSEASARRIMELSFDDKMIDGVVSQMQNGFAPMMKKIIEEELSVKLSSEEIKLLLERFTQWQIQMLSEKLKSKMVRDEMVDIIRRTYTEEETAAVIAFYESDGWQIVRDKTPTMMGETMQRFQNLFADFGAQVPAQIKQLIAEIKAEQTKQ
jgi:hypothetical protein